MDIGSLISDLGKIVVFLMLLLAFYLFTVKAQKRLPVRLFALFLIVTAIDLTGLFIGQWENYPHLYILKRASVALQLPLFYLYVLSTCFSDFSLSRKHTLHFILFFAFVIFFELSVFSKRSSLLYGIVAEIQYFAYISVITIVLYRYRKIYLESYSNTDYSVYKWLIQVIVLFLIGHTFVLIRLLFPHLQNEGFFLNINLLISMNVLLITSWFVLKALYRPHIFTGVYSGFPEAVKALKDKKEGIVSADGEVYSVETKMLLDYMKNAKPYLHENLNLEKLSSQTGTPEKELSAIINRNMGTHFFDFVNEYRISAAKDILQDQDKKDLTILEILYQVGFNSKSSFYTAFKKSTQQTPKQYRKEHLSKSSS